MNSYIQLMNRVIDHIEDNINDAVTIQEIAQKFFFSEFHLSRIFRILVGCSMKQYIQGRKLTLAANNLKAPGSSVIMAAMDYGYKSPEVFCRAFRKQFGISPSAYRRGDFTIPRVTKANVVMRDISNLKGSFAVKNSFVYLEGTNLYGRSVEVDENSSDFEQTLQSAGSDFIQNYSTALNDDKLYSMVSCHGDDSGKYTVFFGGNISEKDRDKRIKTCKLPEGWYVGFHYYGDMLELRSTFVEDLYRWIMIKEIELCPNGIGMLDIYNLRDIKDVNILVPIKTPGNIPVNTAKNIMQVT